MSSEDDNDDLEERKGDLWSMEEVRNGESITTEEAADTEVKENMKETAELEDKSDTKETSDTPGTPDIDSTEDAKPTSAATESELEDSTQTSDMTDTSVTDAEPIQHAEGATIRQMALDAETKELAVRDLHNVNVYLFESVYHDMQTKFKELDTEYYEVYGEDLSKNKDFFNAVFRAGLQSPQLKKELEID